MAIKYDGSYIDAMIEYCKENDILEFDEIVKSIDPILLKKIEAEYIRKKFIPSRKITNSIEGFFE